MVPGFCCRNPPGFHSAKEGAKVWPGFLLNFSGGAVVRDHRAGKAAELGCCWCFPSTPPPLRFNNHTAAPKTKTPPNLRLRARGPFSVGNSSSLGGGREKAQRNGLRTPPGQNIRPFPEAQNPEKRVGELDSFYVEGINTPKTGSDYKRNPNQG